MYGKSTGILDKADKLLRQFPKGITALDFAEKLGQAVRKRPYGRQTGYDYLNSLGLKKRAKKRGTLWYPKEAEAEEQSPANADLLRIALEHGIVTKEDMDTVAFIDFVLQNPELLSLPEETWKTFRPMLKLIRSYHLQKLQTLQRAQELPE